MQHVEQQYQVAEVLAHPTGSAEGSEVHHKDTKARRVRFVPSCFVVNLKLVAIAEAQNLRRSGIKPAFCNMDRFCTA